MFRAYDAERERLVAIKLFKLDLPPERVHQLVAAFEQLVAADLTHPAIAKPLATGMSGVQAYLAQEFVAAESLDLAIREYGPAPPADALRVAAQLAGALDFAGVVNVHHGALHPRDVLLSADDTRLTGLGVAQAVEKVGVNVPVRRPYTAPERTVSAKADIFSLAAIVFELMTGKRVAGTGEQAVEAMTDVAGADAAALKTAFARALAENPDDRFASALEFAEALKGAFPQSSVHSQRSPVPVASRQSKKPKTEDSRQETDDLRPETALPFDVPEATDRADIELAPEPDLTLAQAENERFQDVEVAPAIVPEVTEDTGKKITTADTEAGFENVVCGLPDPPRPDAFGGLERSRSAVWPLVMALGVGIAVGYAGGYAVGSRDRTPAATAPAAVAAPPGREFTESAVKPPPAETRTPEPKPAAQPIAPESVPRKPQSAVAPPVAGPGRLLVRSSPAGARVTVDGRDAGVTPATIRDLARGSHHVQITREGYVAQERRVVITRGRPAQSLLVPLARERTARAPAPTTPSTIGRFAGGLVVDSRPSGAKVFLDGKLIGTTPLATASVAAGEHAIRLERDGYRRWSSSVRVVANEQNRVTASLER